MSIPDTRRPTPQKSSTPKRASGPSAVALLSDEQSFRRRRNHSGITAMTGLILQAVDYPTRSNRDFICALQGLNSGDDARVPHTPFRRAHLTVAALMMREGSEAARIRAVSRCVRVLKDFERATGIRLFRVKSGTDEEVTEYTDYLTPLADAAMQRALSNPLWKGDREGKEAAKAEAVQWAVEQLPRVPVGARAEPERPKPAVSDFILERKRRRVGQAEQDAEEVEGLGGDADGYLGELIRDLVKLRESMRKTAPARLDHSSLRDVLDDEASGEDTAGEGGKTKVDSSVHPPSADGAGIDAPASSPSQGEGVDNSVHPPLENGDDAAPFSLDEPTLFSEGRPEVAAKPKTPLEAALAYARRGWPVFPLHHPDPHRGCSCINALKCKSPGKHPRTRKGLKDASTNPAQIRRWWELYPLANVGLAMGRKSGLVALDVDPRAGGDASLCELIERHGELPATLESVTGGGGSHLFFAHPGVTFKNSSSELAEGLDVKTDGGYVVAAPSLHASGKRYEWRTKRSPASMPGWLLKLLTSEKAPAPPPAKAAAPRRAPATNGAGSIIPHRSRNTQLFRIACALRGDGAGLDEIERAVLDAYEQRCVKEPEPMSESELRKIAKSAMRYPAGR